MRVISVIAADTTGVSASTASTGTAVVAIAGRVTTLSKVTIPFSYFLEDICLSDNLGGLTLPCIPVALGWLLLHVGKHLQKKPWHNGWVPA